MRSFLPVIALSLAASSAQAESAKCADVADAKARLACYDRAAKTKAKAPPAEVPKTALPPIDSKNAAKSLCAAYAGKLDRVMLDAGFNAGIYADGTTLVFFAYLTRPIVYKLITEGKVLDSAKAAECTNFNFVNKGSGPNWYFDLNVPGSCSVNLCWGM